MIIKKFQGKTLEEAMDKAKAELGENIVLLSSKKDVRAKGFFSIFKPKYNEVTVAKEEEEDRSSAEYVRNIKDTIATVDRLRAESNPGEEKSGGLKAINKNVEDDDFDINKRLDSIQSLLEEKLKRSTDEDNKELVKTNASNNDTKDIKDIKDNKDTKDIKDNKENNASISEKNNTEIDTDNEKKDNNSNGEITKKNEIDELYEFLKILKKTMTDNEVNEEYASQLVEELKQNINDNANMEFLLSHIYQKMILKFGKPQLITPSDKGTPKIVYFIGPTGVGKTTTLAKLASQLYLVDKKKVALITTDTYRIAASNQLETYANILSTPFCVVYTHEDMLECYEKLLDYDYILVDTAGHSHNNQEQKNEMNSFVHLLDDKTETEVYLVLSATTKYRDLIAIADTYKELTDYRIIFTKLDETSAYGNMLNLKIHTGKSLSYITCGQNVPDDIDKFDPQETVRQLLSGNE